MKTFYFILFILWDHNCQYLELSPVSAFRVMHGGMWGTKLGVGDKTLVSKRNMQSAICTLSPHLENFYFKL